MFQTSSVYSGVYLCRENYLRIVYSSVSLSINAISINKGEYCLSLVEMAKKRLQVTVREDIVEWIDREVDKLRFASRSHAIEYALLQLMNEEKE